MPEEKNEARVVIKADLRPSYYDEFHCLAAECRISCCKGWSITFDKKDYLSLKRQKGSEELNKSMSKALHRVHERKGLPENTYGEFVMDERGCPLLSAEGLCSLQLEKGYTALPFVCQIFPRAETNTYFGYFERSLGPSCEGVLKLLWERPEGVDFCSDPLPKESQMVVTFHDSENRAAYFQDIRSWCIDMLQDRRYPLPERIMRMGTALNKLTETDDIRHWMDVYCPAIQAQEVPLLKSTESARILKLFLINNVRLLMNIQSADADEMAWRKEILDVFHIQVSARRADAFIIETLPWIMALKQYEKKFGDRDYFLENLMVLLFFHLHMPDVRKSEAIWKSFVNFCNLYSFYRFVSVMSCREGSTADQNELFRGIVHASRALIHNGSRRNTMRDEYFDNDSATPAHMAILLSN